MKTVTAYFNMKALRILAAAAGVLCAVSLFAQEGRPGRGERGERPEFQEPVSDSVWVVNRTQEMTEKYELSADEAKKLMKKKDATRKAYHNYYCEGKWGDSRNYDLCINSSTIGIEGTAGVIMAYVESKAKGDNKGDK